ncbi:hypothetical protein J3459_022405 [Metarhizium acridum]|nr:hypothetical protein J3459_022405 [Metarhizium acridum]
MFPLYCFNLTKQVMATTRRIKSLAVGKSVNLHLLQYSAEEFRQSQPSTSGRPYDKVIVGAAILRRALNSISLNSPRILLLKRSAHEPYFPNVFELPSGKVDPDDSTLKHALAREVKEETGLDVTAILAELNPMIYTTEKTVLDDTKGEVLVSKSAIQLNYVVSASDDTVELSAEEHSESRWVTEGELIGLDITCAMRVVIREAFQWATN